jgi:hypothetical protein
MKSRGPEQMKWEKVGIFEIKWVPSSGDIEQLQHIYIYSLPMTLSL